MPNARMRLTHLGYPSRRKDSLRLAWLELVTFAFYADKRRGGVKLQETVFSEGTQIIFACIKYPVGDCHLLVLFQMVTGFQADGDCHLKSLAVAITWDFEMGELYRQVWSKSDCHLGVSWDMLSLTRAISAIT